MDGVQVDPATPDDRDDANQQSAQVAAVDDDAAAYASAQGTPGSVGWSPFQALTYALQTAQEAFDRDDATVDQDRDIAQGQGIANIVDKDAAKVEAERLEPGSSHLANVAGNAANDAFFAHAQAQQAQVSNQEQQHHEAQLAHIRAVAVQQAGHA